MKRFVFYPILLLFVVISFSCSPELQGSYFFEMSVGTNSVGTPICFLYRLDFYREGHKEMALISIDGFQTMRRIIHQVSEDKGQYQLRYQSLHEEDIPFTEIPDHGQWEMRIYRHKGEWLASQFTSPFDGSILQEEYPLIKIEP